MWTFTIKTGIIFCTRRPSRHPCMSKLICAMRKLPTETETTDAHCQQVSIWPCSAFQDNNQPSVLIHKLKKGAVCVWNVTCGKVQVAYSSIGISQMISAQLRSQGNKCLVVCYLRATRLRSHWLGTYSSVLYSSFPQLPSLKNSENTFQMTNPSTVISLPVSKYPRTAFEKYFRE